VGNFNCNEGKRVCETVNAEPMCVFRMWYHMHISQNSVKLIEILKEGQKNKLSSRQNYFWKRPNFHN